ncbi:MAG: bifunctional ornithine acetyltransferase/N-acetylglutamate synthase, partial [Desulfosarcinaceae bacterium]
MRYRNRDDLGLIVMEPAEGAAAGGVFTANHFCAAPVTLCREHLAAGLPRAVIANAGIANACTGDEGLQRAGNTAAAVAQVLQAAPESVLVASTG